MKYKVHYNFFPSLSEHTCNDLPVSNTSLGIKQNVEVQICQRKMVDHGYLFRKD